MARIERVSYRTGFVQRLEEAGHLPAITFDAADLPEEVLALLEHHLLDLAGTYGDPNAGAPIQYDELRIEHDQGVAEIVVYNRAILLFTTDDDEAVRRIHQVYCRLDDIAAQHRRASLRAVPRYCSSGCGEILPTNPFRDVGEQGSADHGTSDPGPSQGNQLGPNENGGESREQVERPGDVAVEAPAVRGVDDAGHPRDDEGRRPQQHSWNGRYEAPDHQGGRRDSP